MSVIQGILLGVLQGVAEFLPVSSSGHLAVAQKLFGLADVPLLFDVLLHLATLAVVVIYFRKKIWALLGIFGRWITRCPAAADSPAERTADGFDILAGTEALGRRTIAAVIVATVVTGAIGVLTSRLISDIPAKIVAAGFLATAALLIASSVVEKRRAAKASDGEAVCGTAGGLSWRQALAVGVMQGIGTLPGISRSGSTIAGALFCGVSRAAAGEFSFIVSVPAILGAFLLELKDFGQMGAAVGALPAAAGCAAAFVAGYFSLSALMKIIRKGRLEWFACYLIPAGILGVIFL